MELEGRLTIVVPEAAGGGRGTFETLTFRIHEEGPEPKRLNFEHGILKESMGFREGEAQRITEGVKNPVEVILLPTGEVKSSRESEPLALKGWPLGVQLSGKRGPASESWRGTIRAAYSDWLETEYRFTSFGARMGVAGRSTPQAEEEHKMRVRVEGIFLPSEGHVSEGRIEIDFTPLGSKRKTTIVQRIRRTGN